MWVLIPILGYGLYSLWKKGEKLTEAGALALKITADIDKLENKAVPWTVWQDDTNFKKYEQISLELASLKQSLINTLEPYIQQDASTWEKFKANVANVAGADSIVAQLRLYETQVRELGERFEKIDFEATGSATRDVFDPSKYKSMDLVELAVWGSIIVGGAYVAVEGVKAFRS